MNDGQAFFIRHNGPAYDIFLTCDDQPT